MSRGYMCDMCGAFRAGQASQRAGEWHPLGWSEVRTPTVRHLCDKCIAPTGLDDEKKAHRT
jgi:hypothetical protein